MIQKWLLGSAFILAFGLNVLAQQHTNENRFRQLVEELPTPNQFRTATGHPGPAYFQQQVDYDMAVSLDEEAKSLAGEAIIHYHNNSPEVLNYLWLQLDQNIREPNSFRSKIERGKLSESVNLKTIERLSQDFDGGFKINTVQDENGHDLQIVKNHTILKVILSKPLLPGKSTKLRMTWHYQLNNIQKMWGRSGYNEAENGSGDVFAIAQFYPRLCVFNDLGWQIKQFVGSEFALEFGDFKVAITVPADFVVAATGELKNEKEVLTSEQQQRLQQARKSGSPVFIITEEEASANEKSHSSTTKTWQFSAQNVRDFAFACSRKFIWDAMAVQFSENDVLAMSFYPKEANPLWEKYSTKSIAHTLKIYSNYTFDFPYPTASSVNVQGIAGMEYPMICFNQGQPKADKSYTAQMKRGVIGVVHHEVGHNYFPMIINSDERQWAWMDEGFNIFLQGIAERDWNPKWKWSGQPVEMIGYMDDDKRTLTPIMTQADALLQPGMNSYRKPAVALTILRETILGRDLFDQAFKEYAQTWKFKHPQPADFFRIMETASGVDLDWFWRGWYFSTEHVDLAIKNVKLYEPLVGEEQARKLAEEKKASQQGHIATIRDKGQYVPAIELDEALKDRYDSISSSEADQLQAEVRNLNERLTAEERELLNQEQKFYEITFSALGGMLMPLIIQFEYEDGSTEIQRIPVEIWTKNHQEVTKIFTCTKKIKSVTLDPYLETADVDTNNNYWPRKIEHIYFKVEK
ncbi:M1 family metallopeptidase [Sunxiuqinia elliptica]|uniref:Peptidase family M1 n=1 Tax=Sunxiuqinia elliptica TaxID=655355 RepID=A0A1I2K291_9BACT|nr:M1 family metallopeptidase [Sunxiuqinia elliptica]SFF59327.1 Peptidase family M1 [Sunxiuqinia elliptica]